MVRYKTQVHSWKDFARKVRSRGCNLLKRLDQFPNSVLVTGCQRSGTTVLSRIITQSYGMTNYWFGKDDELDTAVILSGVIDHKPNGRYCFQTTYLNECYYEYFEHRNGHKIIWVLRNPFSVVYSMTYNWDRFALNELFCQCGLQLLKEKEKKIFKTFGALGISRLHKACYAYVGKVSQTFELAEKLDEDSILFVEYDALVNNKRKILPAIYAFISLEYKPEYTKNIFAKSLYKASRLSQRQKKIIDEICSPIFQKARSLISLI